jgi:ABC-type multidrug transport system permease subunit
MKDEKPTDYRGFFILGISQIAIGVSLMSSIGSAFVAFLGCGVVFMIIGLANRDKWAKSTKET